MTDDDLGLKRSDEWLDARRGYIGGSDATILMSGDQDKIRNLWLQKTGQRADDDLSAVLPAAMGIITEPLNCHWYQMQTGREVTDRGAVFQHPEHEFMHCTVDGLCLTDDAAESVFEAKHVNAWSDIEKIVQDYMGQIHHNMGCANLEWASLSVFVGTLKYHYFEVALDHFYLSQLIDREVAFWECVQIEAPPPYMEAVEATMTSKLRIVDMTHNNAWCSLEFEYVENQEKAKTYEEAKKSLKGLVEPDVGIAEGKLLKIKRASNGALRFSNVDGKRGRTAKQGLTV